MTAWRLVAWLALCVSAWALLQVANSLVARLGNKPARVAWAVAKVLLVPVISMGTMILEAGVFQRVGVLHAALYTALLADISVSVGRTVARHVSDKGDDPDRPAYGRAAILASLAVTCLVVGLGTADMQTLACMRHEYASEKLERAYTFAFVSDIHAGTAQLPGVLEQFVSEVNAAGVDFVILGGDITDEHTSADEMRAAYQALAGIEAPVYFVYGNHDRQPGAAARGGRTYTDDELVAAIEGAGITILADEAVAIGPDLVLLGREDLSVDGRLPYDQLPPGDGSAFLLVADHQPFDWDQLAAETGDLQVSGHTHAGQLFPNRVIYEALGYPALGERDYGSLQLLVSPGASGWLFPLRTESRCAYEIVELVPAT